MKSKKKSFMFYPEITDKDFYEKIYLKKEFRENEITDSKPVKKEKIGPNIFELEPHQNFLKNYISPDTPYNGILVFHGTGVGKTCTAISIAEGFKKSLRNINKKILVLLTLKDNFINGIYDDVQEKRKKNPDDIVQCTGKEYELGEEYKYLSDVQKKKEILNLIKYYYEFKGYRTFANYVIETTGGWKGEEDKMTEQIKKFISQEFDDRVIIIDEIHNIKTGKKDDLTKNIQPILQSIIKYGKNIKLILMSATPMFDRPDEIIYYLNLLLINDGRKPVDKNDIFNFNGDLKKDAEDKLRDYFKGYVSYIRSEKPDHFPFRIYPNNSLIPSFDKYMSGSSIDIDRKIKYTKIILCNMQNVQANTYLYHYNKEHTKNVNIDNKNLLEENEITEGDMNSLIKYNNSDKGGIRYLSELTKISNIVFPVSSKENSIKTNKKININSPEILPVGTFGKYSIENTSDNGLGGYYKVSKIQGTKKLTKYKYQEHAIFNKGTKNEAPFCDEKHLANYSTKFYSILQEIKKAKGLIFVFSQFIEHGTLPFALMLEQNGFTRECTDGEDKLLDYPFSTSEIGGKRERICFLCGETQGNKSHLPGAKDYHNFRSAKYILYFGEPRDIIRVKKNDALKKFSNHSNRYGEDIKVFIGTRSVSEGLDFKRIRQIHIIEPWYNLSRHEQVIGRGIRRDSHIDLPLEERNCEIFQYASIIPKSFDTKIYDRETIDLKNYRIAENKDIIIKKISRVMKESAVDCVLFRKTNIITDKTAVKQITASGQILDVELADKAYSSMCDYNKDCNYKCNWMPKANIEYPINIDTYNIRFAKLDIEKAKKYIKFLFRHNIIFSVTQIENFVKSKMQTINELFIYKALDIMTNNKEESVTDKFSRKGYIIYRGDYYIFQPFDLKRNDLPMYYRMYPSSVKKKSIDIDSLDIQYTISSLKSKENKYLNNTNDDKLMENVIKEIENRILLYNKILNNDKNKKQYIYAIIGSIVSKMDKNIKNNFIKNVIIKYLNKSNIDIINHILEYLDIEKFLINYYKHINPDKKNNVLYIGYIINNDYYILSSFEENNSEVNIDLDNLEFIKASPGLIYQIKQYIDIYDKKNKSKYEYNMIYGSIDEKLQFKIIDRSFEHEIFTKEGKISKRTIVKGRGCSTYEIEQLADIRRKIGMYEYNSKIRKNFICLEIEIYLRFNNYLKKDDKKWFD